MGFYINIPPIECYIRKEYLYNLESHHGELIEGTAFAAKSIQNNAVLFTVMLADTGALYDKIPISALVAFTGEESKPLQFHVAQLWDCFSYDMHVSQFMFLKGKRAKVRMKDGVNREAMYRFTLDWTANSSELPSTSFSEEPSQHKSGHVLEIIEGEYTGNFIIYPNNRILWAEPSMVSEPFKKIPDYKLNMQKYHCESYDKWATSDDDNFFYDINELKED
jgi:hypothetical protein